MSIGTPTGPANTTKTTARDAASASRLRRLRQRALTSVTGFGRNERGVVAIIFGIAILPALLLAGGATDVMRGSSLKAKAQGAADAAALAGARNLTRSDKEVEAIIRTTLDANLPDAYRGQPFTWTPLDDRAAVKVDFATSMDNYFLGLTSLLSDRDMSRTDVGVTSVANAGERAEVALVVDVTGSMKPHMAALREGSKDFVDILFQGGDDSEVVKVSLVPYVTTVNVKADPSHMAWMDVEGDAKFHGNWFERINHKWGQRNLFVSRSEDCLAPPPPPKNPKPSKPKPSTPKPSKPKPSTPKPSTPPTTPTPPTSSPPNPPKPMPDDLGFAPDLEHSDAPWQRLASLTGDAVYGALDAVGSFLVPSALADKKDDDDKKPKKPKTARAKMDKAIHTKWADGEDDAWRDMSMDDEYVDCEIELQKVNHFDLFEEMGIPWAGCVEMRPEPYDVTDTPPSKARADTLFVPYLWPDEIDEKGSSDEAVGGKTSRNSYIDDDSYVHDWVLNKKPKTAKSKWRDNVHDHGASVQGFLWKYDKIDADAEVRNEFGFGGAKGYDEQSPNAACPDPIVPLTDQRAKLDETIEALRPYKGSGTNVALGLTWGWRTLSPGAPFTEGEAYGAERNRKIIVLMTDGVNLMQEQNVWWTKSDYTGLGYAREARLGTDNRDKIREKLDEKVLEVCETVKDDHEIEVYTIMFNPDKGWWMDDVRKMLQTCATDAKHAFEATSAKELVTVFNQIGSAIAHLRLTK